MNNGIHLFQLTSWMSSSGKWYVNDIKNLAGRSGKWYTPMRVLDLSIENYINLLLNKFNAKGLHYYASTDYLMFYFIKEKDAKDFCSYINKHAKQKNYYCS